MNAVLSFKFVQGRKVNRFDQICSMHWQALAEDKLYESIFCSQALLVTSSSSLPTPQVDSTRNVIQLIQHHRCTIYPNTVERSDVLGFTFPTADIA